MQSIINFMLFFGPFLALIGTYLLILSHKKKHEIEHTIRKGLSTEGTVIEIRENPGKSLESNMPEGYAPVVEFTTINGKYHHHSATFRSPCNYYIGQKVKIYYYFYKSRKEMALLDDDPGPLPKILFKWGILFCAIGYPILLAKMSVLL